MSSESASSAVERANQPTVNSATNRTALMANTTQRTRPWRSFSMANSVPLDSQQLSAMTPNTTDDQDNGQRPGQIGPDWLASRNVSDLAGDRFATGAAANPALDDG